jgi:hypothetical protein
MNKEMKKETKKSKKLVPVSYVTIIQNNTDEIKRIVELEKKTRSEQSRKHLSIREDKLIALAAYLYERHLNFYHQKRQFRGLALTYVCKVIGFSGPIQASIYLLVLRKLEIVKRIGRPVPKKCSYDYIPMHADVTLMSGYRDRSLFISIEYPFNRGAKNIQTYQLLDALNTLMEQSVSLDIDSVLYSDAKEATIKRKQEEEREQQIQEEIRKAQVRASGKVPRSRLKRPNQDLRTIFFEYLEKSYYEKTYSVCISETNDRISSLISSTSNEIRRLIKLDNEETISLDFANSQPAMLAHLLKEELRDGKIHATEDIANFIVWASTGEFYKKISESLRLSISTVKSETWMKGAYGLKALFVNGDEASIMNQHSYLLAQAIPNVVKYLDSMKDIAHNRAATTLQRIESEVVNEIIERMLDSGIKVLPTYDEFRVKKSQQQVAEKCIQDVLDKKQLKVVVRIKG